MSVTAALLGKSKKKKIEFFLPYVRDCDVIDIGCAGHGDKPYENEDWIHQHICAAAASCVGIDHNQQTVSELCGLGYDVILADAQALSVDRQCDVVCAFDIVEHLEDLKGFFDGIHRVLRTEGKLLMSTPNPWFLLRFLRCLIKGGGGGNRDHVHWFCPNTISELLGRFGFEVERLEFGSGEPCLNFLIFMPKALRHTSIYVVATKSKARRSPYGGIF